MNRIKVKSYAKLNLTLNITGKKDGYHELDSFVCTIDLYDEIVVKKRKDRLITVQMHGKGSESIVPEKNNAFKAGESFIKEFDTDGADILIYKNIPIGAGLGGSSADISGTLRAMAELYQIKEEEKIKELADQLGSDTGYLLKGGFARLGGRGEKIEFIDSDKKLSFLLFCPSCEVSTAECYAEYDRETEEKGNQTESCIQSFCKGKIKECGKYFYNSLEKPAKEINPMIQIALQEAKSFAPIGYGMTGSGSAVFALFENESFCRWAESRYKGRNRLIQVNSITQTKLRKKWRNPFSLSEEEKL